MATKEETPNGTSLIFVDTEMYPNGKTVGHHNAKIGEIFQSPYSKEKS